MQNLSSNNPAKFHAIWKIIHVSVTYVGEKTPISDHRDCPRVNALELLHRLQVKIENIYLFKIIIIKRGNVFKNWLCPNFLLPPKKSELPKIWGAAAPLAPPARTPVGNELFSRNRVRNDQRQFLVFSVGDECFVPSRIKTFQGLGCAI